MAQPREIRRLAFQALYQLDARAGRDTEDILATLESEEGFRAGEIKRAFTTACDAWEHRAEADGLMLELAPDWPAHRMAAVDRTILRLGYHEMTRGGVAPKIIINEAVELAKTYGGEKSPGFVNALLDKAFKRMPPVGAEE
jgi:N utilization substance protein B